ncbi:MAG: 5-oxoprolinase subunit C family protein [Desulfitobacteriaceae bacterium]
MRQGPLSLVQDLGRSGFGCYAIPPSGAMDRWALQVGNALVGNKLSEAGLEFSLSGIKARCLNTAVIALAGGSGMFSLNGLKLEVWRSYKLEKGDILDISGITDGCRTYLAIAGGVEVPEVLGSKASYVPAELGGFDGRPLKKGDVLMGQAWSVEYNTRRLASRFIPNYNTENVIRVVKGLHEDLFAREELDKFYSSNYTVSGKSNRMGYRLQGNLIESGLSGNLISDAVVTGAIQVPPDGNPIILGVDRQTTGGYPIIAVVVSADMSKVAQLVAGAVVRFQEITLAEAQDLRASQELFLRLLALWERRE